MQQVDQREVMRQQLLKGLRQAARQDKNYIDSINRYRQRVTSMNLLSTQEATATTN